MSITNEQKIWRNQHLAEGLQECTGCGLAKLLEEFHTHRHTFSGRSSLCKECNKVRCRDNGPMKLYGITRDQYDVYMEDPCAICGAEDTVLDHCHTTGKIRGALCHACNMGLGLYKDVPERLEAAAAYLRSHSDD